MIKVERYLLRTATTACVSGLVVLTGVVWVTQALRQIDLITSKGQTIVLFLLDHRAGSAFTGSLIAPVALFAGILYTLNKLERRQRARRHGGLGRVAARLLRPMALSVRSRCSRSWPYFISRFSPGVSARSRTLTTFVHADFIANFARPGAFSQLESGFMFHFRERTPDGALHGVFMQDLRDPARVTTYIAEAGKTVDRDGASYLQLSKGVCCGRSRTATRSMVTFDDYTIDLSQFMHAVSTMKTAAPTVDRPIDGAE